jgi:Tol biopolymer transport system component
LGPFAANGALPTGAGQIVYVGADGNLGLVDPASGRAQRVTGDAAVMQERQTGRAYLFPTFSADGRTLAFVRLDQTQAGYTQTVQVAEARELPALTGLYATSTDNIPYLDWAPDSRSVAILSLNSRTGSLRLVEAAGGASAVVATGASVYWHWRSDASALIAHTDGAADTSANARLSLVQRSTARTERLAALPGYFQAPHFSPDGQRMLYVAQFGDTESLTLADANGNPQCGLSRVVDAMYFAWSPNGRHVAVIDTPRLLGEPNVLEVIDLGAGRRTSLARNAVSYAWSPNGRYLAIWSVVRDGRVIDPAAVRLAGATPTPAPTLVPTVAPTLRPTATPRGARPATATPRPSPTVPRPTAVPSATATAVAPQFALRLEIADVTTGALIQVADTIPSGEFLGQLQFFDQYSRGASPWSPDGRSLTFVSVDEASDATWIYAARVGEDGRAQIQRLVEGGLAFWSPR